MKTTQENVLTSRIEMLSERRANQIKNSSELLMAGFINSDEYIKICDKINVYYDDMKEKSVSLFYKLNTDIDAL